MSRGVVCILIFIFGFGFISCSDPTSPAPQSARCRIAFSSTNGDLSLTANMESPDGFSLDGGLVQVLDPGSELISLTYDQTKTAYVGEKPSSSSGRYEVFFRSARFGVKKTVVDFTSLVGTPDITEVTDATGNSAFSGQAVDGSQVLNVQWKAVNGATVYGLKIFQGLTLVFSDTSKDSTFLVPSQKLPAHSQLMVQIFAQNVSGDPFFNQADFYAASSSKTVNFYFKTL